MIEKKIISDYWVKKVNDVVIRNAGSTPLQLSETKIVELGGEELSYFNKITNENSIAQYTLLIAAFNAILNRYFPAVNCIFSPSLCDQSVPLLFRFKTDNGQTVKEYLGGVKEEVLNVYKYAGSDQEEFEGYNFEKRTPFGFVFNEKDGINNGSTSFFIKITRSGGTMSMSIAYSDFFSDEYVANHILHNIALWLTRLKDHMNENLRTFHIINDDERKVLLNAFNNRTLTYSKVETLTDLFEKQVLLTPNIIALVHKNKEITYEKLDERVNQLCHYLRKKHSIHHGNYVGVKLDRDETLVIVLLAILKLGASYVPIDPSYPKERIAYIESDSNCKLIIDEQELDVFQKEVSHYPKTKLKTSSNSDGLAYVIYTSGTTGNPKGVMITHQNAVAMIRWAQKEFAPDSFDIMYAVTSYCFDLSIFELFYPLSIGKKIRILDHSLEVGYYVEEEENILLNMVPSGMRSILEAGHDLKNVSIVNLAGEVFPLDIARQLMTTGAQIRNLYGPSEDTTYSTCYQLRNKQYTSIPIGKPIANTQAYVLDDQLKLVPIGVEGKLYLSGDGITRGYLNREELTSQKFIPNPFKKNQSMYDTGDIVKWTSDGNLLFLGRQDHQIKLRGYRIELGEIENAIHSFSKDVSQVLVLKKTVKDEEVLVAYIIQKKAIKFKELKAYLLERIPAYMVPAYCMEIKTMPLTPNGKIEKSKLPEITLTNRNARNYIAPRNRFEKQLAVIWGEILDLEKIGITDSFFELGGHSLKITRLMNDIYKTFNVKISSSVLFHNDILKEQALIIEETLNPIKKIIYDKTENTIETEKFTL